MDDRIAGEKMMTFHPGQVSEVPLANPFAAPGRWFKGAVHVHTTRSDGALSPVEAMQAHRERGYQFLAVTDHDVITDLSSMSDASFLNIPSVEVSYDRNELGQSYHIVVLGVREMADVPLGVSIQDAIDRWAKTGAVIFLAHTYWSGMNLHEMMPLENLTGLEVFNTSSQTDLGKGLATVHWDDVLARGKRWWGYAVDDTHWVSQDNWYYDTFGGWVWVKAAELEESQILTALREGQFYASSGPEIYDYGIEKGVARIRCSPVRTINFVGLTQWGHQRRTQPGELVTEARYELTGNERYLRAECIDSGGHTAWTNPIFLD
jgi:hypothetical protein